MTELGGRYQLGEVLGRGGVAEVYRARDRVLDRDVAVKVLGEAVDDTDRSRFVGEARVLARLSHPGLVTVLDAGTTATQPYLVMELVDGPTLSAVLREGPLTPDRVAAIGTQLASALAYAHGLGVVHRDVKPGNVLLGSDGTVKLADFGIAQLIGDTMRHTRTGTTVGTAAYLSPEQVQGQRVGPATDVYSLGLVLLEAVTGERAFSGTPMEAAMARLHRAPPMPERLPAGWQSLLAAMTAMDPGQRPTCDGVADRLRVLGASAPGPGEATGSHESAGTTRILEVSPTPPASADRTPTERLASAHPREAIDRAGDALATTAVRWWRRFAALPVQIKGVVLPIAALVVVLTVAGTVGRGSEPAEDELPDGTPSELRSPLEDLHDAVHGREP